jgi:hypothetical protein
LVSRVRRSLALSLALAMASAPLQAVAQPAAGAAEIAAGDKAMHAKDYDGALSHFQAANQATPSARAAMGVADSLYQLGRAGEAYDAYNTVQNTYGAKLGVAEKVIVIKRLKELAAKTGWLSVRVGESGAQVDLDGKSMGVSPVPVLVRVATGPHDVKVSKDGFAPFTGHADVAADGTAVIEVKLASAVRQGHVVVHASGTEPLRVIVDGVDVGATPWEGDLPAGTHTFAGRSSSAVAESQSVELTAGSRTAIDLVSSATAGHMQVRTSDGKGTIFVDGVAKGEGTFSGDVAPGPHTVVVTREGFQRYEKAITLAERQTWAETVTLQQVAATGATASEGERALEGMYGGFGFIGAFGVGGMGTELETDCRNLGADSCNTPSPVGGGAFGYVGFTWNPVGFELLLGGMGDQVKQTATFTGTSSLPTATGPARTETFNFARAGGVAALRARATFQTRAIRGTVAGGLGVSYKQMFMERDAVSASDSSLTAKYVPGSVGYLSPAITAEAAIQIRVTQTVAISVGGFLWADNASIAGSNSVPAGSQQLLSNGSSTPPPQPFPTPQYHLATGAQVFIGPFVGMQFGP